MTLKEIADQSGLSPSTLSRAVTGNGYLSEAKRAEAMRALEAADYFSDSAKRAMRAPMRDVILFISGSTGNVYERVIQSLTTVAARDKIRVLAAHTNYDNQMELQLLRYAERCGCRGVVMSSVGELENTIRFIRTMRVPLVTVARSLPGIADAVTQDSYEMGSMAAQFFLDAGHRHLAYLGGPTESSITTDKLHGYRDVIRSYGLSLCEEDIAYGRLNSQSGHEYARQFLSRDSRPTAVFISNDLMAIGFIREITAAGLRVRRRRGRHRRVRDLRGGRR